MDFVAELKGRLDVIRQHWWTFSISVALGAVIAFIAATFLYEARIETVEAVNVLLRDRIESGLDADRPVPPIGPSLPWLTIGLVLLGVVVVVAIASVVITAAKAVSRQRRQQSTPPATEIVKTKSPRQPPPVSRALIAKASSGEVEARPHVQFKSIAMDKHTRPKSGEQIRVQAVLENCTGSTISECTIRFDRIVSDGVARDLGAFLPLADRVRKISLGPAAAQLVILAYRNYKVAPDEPFKIHGVYDGGSALAEPPPLTLKDHSKNVLYLTLDPGTGVKTRASIEIAVGEYEEAEARLLNQSSWRLPH